MANILKKSLIIDSSGIRPFVFAEKNLGLSAVALENFMDYIDSDLFLSDRVTHEFSFSYGSQSDIFTAPLTSSLLVNAPRKNFSISLSDAGYFSLTGVNANQLSIGVSKTTHTIRQGRLWESSSHWQQHLSSEDKSLITLAYGKVKTYDKVAILTNDWHLRQQCLNFDRIFTYGSASMLAGMVFTGFITVQQGTYIYGGWLKEEQRWIPYSRNEYGGKRKLKFREVLEIEKSRMQKKNSFWSP